MGTAARILMGSRRTREHFWLLTHTHGGWRHASAQKCAPLRPKLSARERLIVLVPHKFSTT